MKKLKIILMLLALPLVLTGCTKKNQDDSAVSSGGDKSDQKEETITGSLAELVKLGKSFKCTAEVDTGDSKMQILSYVSGKKYYSEMLIEMPAAPENNLTTYTLSDGEWLYSWGGMMGATKVKMSTLEDIQANVTDEQKQKSEEMAKTTQEAMSYKCTPWLPDNGKFSPPTDINFSDTTESTKNMIESFSGDNLDEMKQNGCSICESIPGEDQQQQCKDKLGC